MRNLVACLAFLILLAPACSQSTETTGTWSQVKQVHSQDHLLADVTFADGRHGYLIAVSLVPDGQKRRVFESALGALVFGTLQPSDGTPRGLDCTLLERVLPRDLHDEFTEVVIKLQRSKIWGDGNQYAPYDILLDPCFRPRGASLVVEDLQLEAERCTSPQDYVFQLIDLAVAASAEMTEMFKAVARCAIKNGRADLIAVSVVGLARGGDSAAARRLVDSAQSQMSGNPAALQVLARTRENLDNLPGDERGLEELIERLAVSGPVE